MKAFVFFKGCFLAFTACLSLICCTKESLNKEVSSDDFHTCQMRLVGSRGDFDQPQTKAPSSSNWDDGSTIYLRLNSPMGTTLGTAVYKKSTDVWTVSYHGSLYEDVANSCSAVYVQNYVSVENSVITLNENSVVFEDQSASYLYSGEDLVVTANLKPKTGRIHLQGASGKVLKVYGISHYTTYDFNTNLYTDTTEEFKTKVESDGFTPYLYGYFNDPDVPSIKIWIDAKEAYTRFLSKNLFKAGDSGVLTIPTSDNFTGWSDGLVFTYNGETMKMIAVEGGTFTMGVEGSTDNYYMSHSVTLDGFCIGETDNTRAMYYAIINSSTTRTYEPCGIATSSNPRDYVLNYTNNMTNTLHAAFTLPTEAQWEFAAIGGKKSKGFFYSGSNDFSEVGYEISNYASSNPFKPVKTKMPNELGLYDMSGNAPEVCLDNYSNYPSSSQINPLNMSGSYMCTRPGYGTYGVRTRSSFTQSYGYSSYYYHAIRPALNWN